MHTATKLAARRLRRLAPALLLPAVALADEPNDLGTVWVVGRIYQPVAEVAASVSVIDEAALGAPLARDLRDATRYTPGVSVPNDAVRFGTGTISIRGVGGNRVLIETDGVPAPQEFAIGNFSDFGRPSADLDLVQRTEIMRGPASALYGSDAIGGVVSTRTLSPAELLGSQDSSVRLRSAYYSADHSWLASGAIAERGPAGVQALLAYARREGSALGNGDAAIAPNPQDYVRDSVLAKFALGDMHSPVGLTVGRTRTAALTLVNSDVLQPGRFANTTYMQADDHADSTRVIVDQTLTLAGFEQGEWRAYWQQSSADQATHETRRAAPPQTPALDIHREFSFDETTLGAQSTLVRVFGGASLAQRLVLGAELQRHRIDEERDGLQTNLQTNVATNVILGEVFPLRDFPQTAETQAGIYAQDEIRRHGGRAAWIPAIRVDYDRLEPSADPVYTARNPGQTPVSVSHASVSPRFGVTWDVLPHQTLFAQYARGFRAPPFADVNIGLYLPQFNVRAIPNPNLKPETSDGIEAGLRSTAAGASGSVSAFYTRFRDFIASKVNIGVDPATGATLFQSLNLARTEIWGFEAEGRLQPGEWRARLAPLSVRFALSFAYGEDTVRHEPLNAIDPAKGVIGLVYEAPGGAWSAELTTTAVARKSRVDDSTTTIVRTGGYAIFDLVARWHMGRHVTLDAGAFNLANRSYFDWTDVNGRAANDPTLPLYQRPGRNLSVSIVYRP